MVRVQCIWSKFLSSSSLYVDAVCTQSDFFYLAYMEGSIGQNRSDHANTKFVHVVVAILNMLVMCKDDKSLHNTNMIHSLQMHYHCHVTNVNMVSNSWHAETVKLCMLMQAKFHPLLNELVRWTEGQCLVAIPTHSTIFLTTSELKVNKLKLLITCTYCCPLVIGLTGLIPDVNRADYTVPATLI